MNHIFDLNYKHKIYKANGTIYKMPVFFPSNKTNEHIFIYVTEGELEICQENENYTIKKNNLLILGNNLSHHGTKLCPKNTRAFIIHTSVNDGDRHTFDDSYELSKNQVAIKSLVDCSYNHKILSYIMRIMESKLYTRGEIHASSCFDVLLCELFENSLHSKHEYTLAHKIAQLIDSNHHVVLKNQEIAKTLGVSVKTAENSFKECFDMSLHQYVLLQKINQAKYYLENYPGMKIIDLGIFLGFYDEYHFSRQFKKFCGISPSEYKKKYFNDINSE